MDKQITACEEHPSCALMTVSGPAFDAGPPGAAGIWHFMAHGDQDPGWTISGPQSQRAESLIPPGYSAALALLDSVGRLVAHLPMEDVAIRICEVAWPGWRAG